MTWGTTHVEFDGHTLTAALSDEDSSGLQAWIASLLGTDHLSVLLGSGLSIAAGHASGVAKPLDMGLASFSSPLKDQIDKHAESTAKQLDRGSANVEDQLRSALQLAAGLDVLEDARADDLKREIGGALRRMAELVLEMERGIDAGYRSDAQTMLPLIQFVLGISQRPPSRDRTQVFTTNYDRVIEFACDIAGIRTLDRFVGSLSPVFRASRIGVDLHYNPPGIRGEPRYLEGVIRVSKLHGSIDWRYREGALRRDPLGFGSDDAAVAIDDAEAFGTTMIYPNPAKDVETLGYPYAELFRDFSAAICRPGTTLMTYGYGFGDDHLNRVIVDMSSIASTHLLVVSFDDAGGRIPKWLARNIPESQRTIVAGSDLADLQNFSDRLLPAPSLNAIRGRLSSPATSSSPAVSSSAASGI